MTDDTAPAVCAHDRPDWWREPLADRGFRSGCLNCGACPDALPLTTPLCVGFGFVSVTRDGESIWSGDDMGVWLRRFERRAASDPDHDWRVEFVGPMSETIYQRHGTAEWVLIAIGNGFA